MDMTCRLSINDLRLWANLGNSVEEQANPQPISIYIQLSFLNKPLACTTDNLSDSVCYAEIVELIRNITQNKTFNLLEHLTNYLDTEIYQYLEKISPNVKLKIIVTKLSPPVPNIFGGVAFELERKV